MGQYKHNGFYKREAGVGGIEYERMNQRSERRGDAMFLALKMEEGATFQEMRAFSRS